MESEYTFDIYKHYDRHEIVLVEPANINKNYILYHHYKLLFYIYLCIFLPYFAIIIVIISTVIKL